MKILRLLKNILFPSKSKVEERKNLQVSLPLDISDSENIVRFLYSPINFNKKNKPKDNCFRPPNGLDEVSVNRSDFTEMRNLKEIAMMNQSKGRDFKAILKIKAQTIRENGFNVVYTPINDGGVYNPFHSDVKIGCFAEKGCELPAEVTQKIKLILKTHELILSDDIE